MARLGTILLAQMMAASSFAAGAAQLASDVQVTDLRCEYLADPLGIDVAQPRLSWRLQSPWRGQKQTAYQILVAGSEEIFKDGRADLWDTGKVASDQSIHVIYGGKPLSSRTRCCWKVRIWDENDRASEFSKPAAWEMGLLTPEDWKGKWISTADANEVESGSYEFASQLPG